MRSSRRGSVSTTTDGAGGSNRAVGWRAAITARDEADEVDRLERDLLGRGIEARQLHELLDERPQPPHVGHQQLGRSPALRRQLVEVLAHDRRLGDERGDRRPQLVRHVGHEPAVLVLGRLEPPDRVREDAGHPVEPLGPGPELVARRDGHPRRQVAALDPFRDPTGLLDRRQDAARDEPRRRPARRAAARGAPSDRARRSWSMASRTPADVADEVERRPALGRATTDDERGHPADVEPAHRQLATVDLRAHVRREPLEQAGQVAASTGTDARPGRGRRTVSTSPRRNVSARPLRAMSSRRRPVRAAGGPGRHGQVEAGLVGGRLEDLVVQPQRRRTARPPMPSATVATHDSATSAAVSRARTPPSLGTLPRAYRAAL